MRDKTLNKIRAITNILMVAAFVFIIINAIVSITTRIEYGRLLKENTKQSVKLIKLLERK